MKHYVYLLADSNNKVEYIGETKRPKGRFYQHTKSKPNGSSCGKFYGRTDITMHVVNEFDNKKDAFNYQCELQKQYGFKTDREINKGRNHTIDTKLKISKNRIGKGIGSRDKFTEEHKQKLKEAKQNISKETRQKMREAKLGKIRGTYKTKI